MAKEKNKYGQYFTIAPIAEFMVSLITAKKTAKVLEPSCGKGIFIEKLYKAGYEDVTAYEIDSSLESNFPIIKYESFITSPIDEKFDVVIGNPPYIRWKNLEQELKEELNNSELWNNYFNSLCDYLYIFILKSIEQLNDGGELIFICTEYWLNTTHSISLRNYMCQNGYFTEIFHFKESPLFENVTASIIIFKYVKGGKRADEINLYLYNKKGQPNLVDLQNYSCFDLLQIPQFKKDSRWILASEEKQIQLKQFEKKCLNHNTLFDIDLHRIGDCCEIGNGMVSGLDAAFAISRTDNLNDVEKSFLIEVLKAKDLEQYRYDDISHYIFVENICNESFENDCPNLVEHFKEYRSNLDKRYDYGKNIPYWEFVFPRNRSLFERTGDKIFVPCKERISHKKYFRFCLAPEGVYPLQDVTGIVKKESCKESIEYLLAYLNTEDVFDWILYNGIVKGEIVEFSEAPIASIPYRPINWNIPKEVEIHNNITKEINNYLSDNDEWHLLNIKESFKTLFNA